MASFPNGQGGAATLVRRVHHDRHLSSWARSACAFPPPPRN